MDKIKYNVEVLTISFGEGLHVKFYVETRTDVEIGKITLVNGKSGIYATAPDVMSAKSILVNKVNAVLGDKISNNKLLSWFKENDFIPDDASKQMIDLYKAANQEGNLDMNLVENSFSSKILDYEWNMNDKLTFDPTWGTPSSLNGN